MCRCAQRRTDISEGSRAALRGDLAEVKARAASVANSVRLDLEMARAAAARGLNGLLRR